MNDLARALEGSVVARSGCAACVAVVLAAGLVSAGLHAREDPSRRPVPSTSIVVPRQAAANTSPATVATVPTTTIPPPAPTTTALRKTPPFQVVPDDPSATVPPPVLGIDPVSGD